MMTQQMIRDKTLAKPASGTAPIRQFMQVLKPLQALDPAFPLQYALCLAMIAVEEGMCLTTLADRTGLALSTVSRIVGALSDKRQMGQAFGLITVEICPQERRRKALFLTPRGRSVVQGITRAMQY